MFRNIRARLVAFTVLLTISIYLVSLGLIYLYIGNHMITVSSQYTEQLMTQFCENIQTYLNGISKETYSISYLPNIKYYNDTFRSQKMKVTKQDAKKVLWDSFLKAPDINDINILLNDERIISLFNMYDEQDLVTLSHYYAKNDTMTSAKFIPVFHSDHNGLPALSCIKSIRSSSDFFLITSINAGNIFSLVDQIDLGEGSGACLVDANGAVLYPMTVTEDFDKNMQTVIGDHLTEDGCYTADINHDHYLISDQSFSNSELRAVIYTPLANVTGSVNRFLIRISFLILGLLLLFIIISVRVSNNLVGPINHLVHSVNQISSASSRVNPIRGTVEIDILVDAFNNLLQRIDVLIQKNRVVSNEKRIAEIHALQYQINPHFLYNTLDSINAMAILNDEYNISEMTTSLANLLRLSINQLDEYITVRDEIKYLSAYVSIQQIRYNNKFSVEFHVDDRLLDQKIIRLILQPLVENAIYHGLEPKETSGVITISITLDDPYVQILVSDDGVGLDSDQVQVINQHLSSHQKPDETKSIGIYNVGYRLWLYYADNARMKLISQEGVGTTIQIDFPVYKENANVESTDC